MAERDDQNQEALYANTIQEQGRITSASQEQDLLVMKASVSLHYTR